MSAIPRESLAVSQTLSLCKVSDCETLQRGRKEENEMERISPRLLQQLLQLLWRAEKVEPGSSFSVVLVGPTGSGKTTAVYQFARDNGIPIAGMSLVHSELPDLIGKLGADGGYITPVWARELLQTGGVLFLDELNRAREEFLPALFSLISQRKVISVDLSKLPLLVVAAANPSAGGYWVSPVEGEPAFRRRLVPLWYEPTTEERLEHVAEISAPPELALVVPVTTKATVENPTGWEPVGFDETLFTKFLKLREQSEVLFEILVRTQFRDSSLILSTLKNGRVPITAVQFYSGEVTVDDVVSQDHFALLYTLTQTARECTSPERVRLLEKLCEKVSPEHLMRVLTSLPDHALAWIGYRSPLRERLEVLRKGGSK